MPIKSRRIVDDETLVVELDDGREATLVYQSTCSNVLIKGNKQCGEIGFEVRYDDFGHGQEREVARIIRAFNEEFRREGVGTEAVKWFLFQHGIDPEDLEFPEHDGIRRNNGEHLTGDAPAFYESLRRKIRDGLLADDYGGI